MCCMWVVVSLCAVAVVRCRKVVLYVFNTSLICCNFYCVNVLQCKLLSSNVDVCLMLETSQVVPAAAVIVKPDLCLVTIGQVIAAQRQVLSIG